MKCSICNKRITMKDWLNEANIIKTYYAHWMPAADGLDQDEYAHKTCYEAKGTIVMENNPTIEDLINYLTKPKTIPSLSKYLNDVLTRTLSNRGDVNKDLVTVKEGYEAGFHDGIEQTIKYVLQALEELESHND